MKRLMVGLLLALTLVVLGGTADAVLINSSAELTGDTTVIDFSQFTGANQHHAVNGPVQIGGNVGMNITASSQTGSLYLYDGTWGLLDNGIWTSGRQGYLGVWPNDGPVTINFTFESLMSGVGGFMNYIVGSSYSSEVTLTAFDSSNNVLEVYDILSNPISTPGGTNAGAFRGISRATADIASVQIYGQGIVLDDLTLQGGAAPIPEPATMVMLGSGIAGIFGFRKKLKV